MLKNVILLTLGISLAGFVFAQGIPSGSPSPPEPPGSPKRVVVIPIEGEINGITTHAVKTRLDRAHREGVDIVVIKLNTPGGLVMSAMNISEALKSVEGIHTLAFVDRRAYSAGALISLACNEIVISDGGAIGDCAPILMQGELEGVKREKGESFLRAEFRDSATRNGYNLLLAQSMVTMDISVYQIRHKETGEVKYVDKRGVRERTDFDPRVEELGKVLPKEGESVRRKQEWEYVKTVVDSTKLLTMTDSEAVEYGFAKLIVQSDQEVLDYLGADSWEIWEWSWGEAAVGFLNSMAVTGILTAVGLIAIYVALNSPGFGVPEGVAIVCFAVLFGSKYLAGIAEWWTIALFLIGIGLLAVELFVLPGFGLAGGLGVLFVVVGLIATVMPKDPGPIPLPRTDVAWDMFIGYLVWLTGGFLVFIAAAILLAKYLPSIPKLGKLVLAEAPAAIGPEAAHPPDVAPGIGPGQLGVAIGPLRPAGQARFRQQVADVVTEGELIDIGSQVEVIRRAGNRIVVRRKA